MLGFLISVLLTFSTGCTNQSFAAGSEMFTGAIAKSDSGLATVGPLDEYRAKIFGIDWQDVQDISEAESIILTQQIARDEFLTACMEEKGFTYYPTSPFRRWRIWEPEPGKPVYGTMEWAARFGFGISTEPHVTIQLAWHRTLGKQTLPLIPEAIGDDLNFDASMRMAHSERRAWGEALHGVMRTSTEAYWRWSGTPWDQVPLEYQGCEVRWVLEEEARLAAPAQFEVLAHQIEGFEATVATDPRVANLNSQWSTCMSNLGELVWDDPFHPITELLAAWETRNLIDPNESTGWDWARNPEGPPHISASEFRDLEIRIALADWNCREKLHFDAAVRAVNLELQQCFVELHRTELELWVQHVQTRVR
jgi:hypothetical protein